MRNNLLKSDKQRCAMTTVSALMAEHSLEGIDFLKIDVEGAELDVLHGIRPEDWPRIHQASNPEHCIMHRHLRAIRAAARLAYQNTILSASIFV